MDNPQHIARSATTSTTSSSGDNGKVYSAPEVVQRQTTLEVAPTHDKETFGTRTTLRQHPDDYPMQANGDSSNDVRHRFHGLSPRAFWAVILAVAIIAIAGIGGGIGGGLAAHHKSAAISKPTTVTVTETMTLSSTCTASGSVSTSTVVPGTTYSTGCGSINTTIHTPINYLSQYGNQPYFINGTSLNYQIYCGLNLAPATNKANTNIGALQLVTDIPYLNDCILACAMYNFALNSTATAKTGPSWGSLCSGIIYSGGDGNPTQCMLQSGVTTSALNVQLETTSPLQVTSAVLVWQE